MFFHDHTKKQFVFFVIFLVLIIGNAVSQNSELTLLQSDIRLEYAYSTDNKSIIGYNLFVRKKTGLESVLLTEPNGEYALRTTEWNSVNGNEIRYINGKPLTDKNASFSIISSTPINDKEFGNIFKLFMPAVMVYGSKQSQNGGTINIKNRLYINIRTFNSKYADYTTGRFQNNLFSIMPSEIDRFPEITPRLGSPKSVSDQNDLIEPRLPNVAPVREGDYFTSFLAPPVLMMPYSAPPVPIVPFSQSPTEKTHNKLTKLGFSDEFLHRLINKSNGNVQILKSNLESVFNIVGIDIGKLHAIDDSELIKVIKLYQ